MRTSGKILSSLLLCAGALFLAQCAGAPLTEDINAYKGRDPQATYREILSRAEEGEARAQYHLGAIYQNGEGAPKDYARAYQWYSLSAARGNGDAAKALALIEKRMTRGQIAEAQRLARRFRPSARARPSYRGNGSGFIVSESGDLLTNAHIVSNCRALRVSPPGSSAALMALDPVNDLALLQVSPYKSMKAASFQTSAARLGGDVITAGYPLRGHAGRGLNITKGSISALAGRRGDSRMLQFTAPIQPGNSGGPLIDEEGLVVGVITSRLEREVGARPVQNVNFALRADVARAFLDSHAVPYEVAGSAGKSQRAEGIAEEARDYTVMVECFR